MKFNEITSKFNPYLNAIVAEGFTICMTELTGSYSEVRGQHAVFAKGRERVVMWLTDVRGEHYSDKGIALHIARWEMAPGEKADWQYNWPKNWAENIIWEATVYRVSDDWYVDDEAEAQAALRVRQAHREAKRGMSADLWCWRRITVTDGLYRVARKLNGLKSVKRGDLAVERRTEGAGWRFINTATGTKATVEMQW